MFVCFTRASLFVLGLVILFCVFPPCFLVASTSAIDCLERLVSVMTLHVSSGTLNPTHSQSLTVAAAAAAATVTEDLNELTQYYDGNIKRVFQ